MKKIILSLILTLGLSNLVNAQEVFPTRPVKIVTNLPVGASPDVYARKMAQELEKKWGQPVIVENKPGGGGLVSLEYFLSQPADGHTIYFGDFGIFVSVPILYNKDYLFNQIKPSTVGFFTHWILITPPHITTLDQLKQELKKNPTYGSWGVGSGGHLCGAEISTVLGIETQHVTYKEISVWLTDIANGTLPFGCSSIGTTESFYKAGKLNYLAVADTKRDRYYPSLPTISELTGHSFQTGEIWSAFYVNVKTDVRKTKIIEEAIREANRSTQMIDVVTNLKGVPSDNSSKEMGQVRKKSIDTYRRLIKKYNITIE